MTRIVACLALALALGAGCLGSDDEPVLDTTDETGTDIGTTADDPIDDEVPGDDDPVIDDDPVLDDTPIVDDDEPVIDDDEPVVEDDGTVCNDGWETPRPEGWTQASHCKGVDPDYDRLFDDTVVHRFDVTVSAESYAATMADLTELLGSPSSGGGGPGGGPGGGGPGGGGGGSLDDTENPMWVPVEVRHGGMTWTNVGMRYKGNSSLHSAWSSGTKKLAFRLDFDEFEDDHPEIDDQRFWGFKKMTFSNGFKDSSLIRDKVAADIFRDCGVPAARGAFAAVYVDFGEGSTYFGLYTMIEDPEDEMLGVQFEDDDGNLYKPEGDGATFQSFDEVSFDKETNEDEADWSDIIATIDALHAESHDAETWRANLEAVFNVDAFLRWLAVNQAIVNWDTYGTMNHNFYLYGDPTDGGRLVWFPWDLNEALIVKTGGPGGGGASSVMLDEVSDSWPLIRYLLDDPTYRATYRAELADVLAGGFAVEPVQARMQAYHDLIAPYVVGPEAVESGDYTFLSNASAFEGSLTSGSDALLPHVESRHVAVEAALASE